MKTEEENRKEPMVKMSEEIAAGVYSNMAILGHSSSEFVLDFVSMLPGVPAPEVKSRIILAPEHAKRLLAALQDNIRKYEEVFGPIDMHEDRQTPSIMMPQGQA